MSTLSVSFGFPEPSRLAPGKLLLYHQAVSYCTPTPGQLRIGTLSVLCRCCREASPSAPLTLRTTKYEQIRRPRFGEHGPTG
jgi:hypothetical protein